MAAGYQADNNLWRHAGHLNALSDTLRDVALVARQARIPAGAYGRYCQGFPMMLGAVEQSGAAACDSAAVATESAASAIRSTAEAYQVVEQTFVRRAGALE